jgi:hypothetical protein
MERIHAIKKRVDCFIGGRMEGDIHHLLIVRKHKGIRDQEELREIYNRNYQ